ncbi:cupredoxin domain-containing protein [bacterium]|nr:cupredoxin domain-containing protein [bacterium]MBU1985148.1 cupredoxin domain-containing protein [bacterium]
MIENPWIILLEILLAAGILIYLFFRRKSGKPGVHDRFGRVEAKLKGGKLDPPELRAPVGRLSQLVIHRYDQEPREELIEIADLEIYELLPALNTTIIRFQPEKRGTFPIVLGAEREIGTLIVE